MSTGLFDTAAAAPAPVTEGSDRRVKLFPWDAVASQLFEPYGESSLDSMGLKELWEATCKGNKKARYHSHLCADGTSDSWHVGAGISMTASALQAAIKNWEGSDMARLIKPEFYSKVNEDIAKLKPILEKLNVGKGSQTQRDTGSFRVAKKQKLAGGAAPTCTEAQMDEAAKEFHTWLSQEKSAFRSALFILSGNGSYYAAHAAELVARAAVHHKPMTAESFRTAMRARSSRPAEVAEPAAASSDATGLFN